MYTGVLVEEGSCSVGHGLLELEACGEGCLRCSLDATFLWLEARRQESSPCSPPIPELSDFAVRCRDILR